MDEPVGILRQGGMRIAIEDGSSGRGLMESLLLLRPDVVKLSPEHLRGIDDGNEASPSNEAIRRVVRFANHARAEVYAVGVENDTQRALLAELGVIKAQGKLGADPEPVEVAT